MDVSLSPLTAADKRVAPPPDPLREATRDFEGIFVAQMLAAMRRTAPRGGAIAPSGGEEMFRQMLDQEVAQRIAHSQGMGIGDLLYRELSGEKK